MLPLKRPDDQRHIGPLRESFIPSIRSVGEPEEQIVVSRCNVGPATELRHRHVPLVHPDTFGLPEFELLNQTEQRRLDPAVTRLAHPCEIVPGTKLTHSIEPIRYPRHFRGPSMKVRTF
jgi:hypothetical protein